uniref:Uncharacterized protein n=1 Tax=Sphaerodactylus townsendi TaxID=933632 RepID=A0ACB8G4B9_9SAUR
MRHQPARQERLGPQPHLLRTRLNIFTFLRASGGREPDSLGWGQAHRLGLPARGSSPLAAAAAHFLNGRSAGCRHRQPGDKLTSRGPQRSAAEAHVEGRMVVWFPAFLQLVGGASRKSQAGEV